MSLAAMVQTISKNLKVFYLDGDLPLRLGFKNTEIVAVLFYTMFLNVFMSGKSRKKAGIVVRVWCATVNAYPEQMEVILFNWALLASLTDEAGKS